MVAVLSVTGCGSYVPRAYVQRLGDLMVDVVPANQGCGGGPYEPKSETRVSIVRPAGDPELTAARGVLDSASLQCVDLGPTITWARVDSVSDAVRLVRRLRKHEKVCRRGNQIVLDFLFSRGFPELCRRFRAGDF